MWHTFQDENFIVRIRPTFIILLKSGKCLLECLDYYIHDNSWTKGSRKVIMAPKSFYFQNKEVNGFWWKMQNNQMKIEYGGF